jgi:hypothetical protein
MVRIDVLKSPQLLATIYALRSIDKTLQAQVRKYTKMHAEPEWRKALAERADTRLEHRVIVDTSVVSVSNQNVRIQSASKGRPLTGGLNPKTTYAPVEFGGKKGAKSTYRRKSRKGGTHSVTRDTRAQLKPFRRGGYVFWPAAKEMVPRLAALWVQTAVKTIGNALEGKRE